MLSSSPTEYEPFWMEYRYGSLRSDKNFRVAVPDKSPEQSPPPSPSALVASADGSLSNLRELLDVLQSNNGLRMLKTAYRSNMTYKIDTYTELLRVATEDIDKHVDIMHLTIPDLKRLANVKTDDDNWVIFESVNAQYKEAKAKAAVFEANLQRATEKMSGSMGVEEVRSSDAIRPLRDELVRNLRSLTNFTSSQPHVIKKVVDIVGSFLKDPSIVRKKLMTFMLCGGAGTGKTTLANAIGRVFASAGMFVSGSVVEAGRAELVGQYEGQTVARTQNFLVSNLDNGITFIDEAYAITPWDKGKPEGYGSEAATAMVEFMTKYPGLYCIIVAGYEKQMVRYFLGSNEGLPRRFSYKFVLRDFSMEDLVVVFKRKLLEIQGIPIPDGKRVTLASERYFTSEAWGYLRQVVQESLKGGYLLQDEYDEATRKSYKNVKTFLPQYEYMHALFENQAGSMSLLADEAVTVLMTTLSYDDVYSMQRKMGIGARPEFRTQGLPVMKRIVRERITTMALSNRDEFISELEAIERGL
jgi:SpoVK/Ycf46/Vps4 family AAA+-type ATPase